jgi:hypothetical protein
MLAYTALRAGYDSMPPLGWLVPVPMLALAVIEFVIARRVRAAVRHEPDARPMEAVAIARCVALGKATSLVGSGVTGAAAALMARVLPDAGTVTAAEHDARVGAFLLASAIVMAAAGLVLERAGIDPNSQDRDRPGAPN